MGFDSENVAFGYKVEVIAFAAINGTFLVLLLLQLWIERYQHLVGNLKFYFHRACLAVVILNIVRVGDLYSIYGIYPTNVSNILSVNVTALLLSCGGSFIYNTLEVLAVIQKAGGRSASLASSDSSAGSGGGGGCCSTDGITFVRSAMRGLTINNFVVLNTFAVLRFWLTDTWLASLILFWMAFAFIFVLILGQVGIVSVRRGINRSISASLPTPKSPMHGTTGGAPASGAVTPVHATSPVNPVRGINGDTATPHGAAVPTAASNATLRGDRTPPAATRRVDVTPPAAGASARQPLLVAHDTPPATGAAASAASAAALAAALSAAASHPAGEQANGVPAPVSPSHASQHKPAVVQQLVVAPLAIGAPLPVSGGGTDGRASARSSFTARGGVAGIPSGRSKGATGAGTHTNGVVSTHTATAPAARSPPQSSHATKRADLLSKIETLRTFQIVGTTILTVCTVVSCIAGVYIFQRPDLIDTNPRKYSFSVFAWLQQSALAIFVWWSWMPVYCQASKYQLNGGVGPADGPNGDTLAHGDNRRSILASTYVNNKTRLTAGGAHAAGVISPKNAGRAPHTATNAGHPPSHPPPHTATAASHHSKPAASAFNFGMDSTGQHPHRTVTASAASTGTVTATHAGPAATPAEHHITIHPTATLSSQSGMLRMDTNQSAATGALRTTTATASALASPILNDETTAALRAAQQMMRVNPSGAAGAAGAGAAAGSALPQIHERDSVSSQHPATDPIAGGGGGTSGAAHIDIQLASAATTAAAPPIHDSSRNEGDGGGTGSPIPSSTAMTVLKP